VSESQDGLGKHLVSSGHVDHSLSLQSHIVCRPRRRGSRLRRAVESVVLVMVRRRRLGALNAQPHRVSFECRLVVATRGDQVVVEVLGVAHCRRRRTHTAVTLSVRQTTYRQTDRQRTITQVVYIYQTIRPLFTGLLTFQQH